MTVINSVGDSPPNQQEGVIHEAEEQQVQQVQQKTTTEVGEKERKK